MREEEEGGWGIFRPGLEHELELASHLFTYRAMD